MEAVDELLQQKVVVFHVGAAQEVVLRVGVVIEARRVDGVAVSLQQGSVVEAVHRKLGVAVGVAAVDIVGLAAGDDFVVADRFEVSGFVRMDGVNRDLRLHARLQLERASGGGRGDFGDVDIGLVDQHRGEVAVVGRPGRGDAAVFGLGESAAHVHAPVLCGK